MGATPGDVRSLANLRVLFAPAARDQGAIVDDPEAYAVARAVIGAMGATEHGTMTRGQILDAAGLDGDDDWVRARFELFVRLGMLRTVRGDKPHQQRYYLHPFALIGGELLDRLAERGAAVELHNLLTAAAHSIGDDTTDAAEAAAVIEKVTAALRSFADLLEDVVAHDTVTEMLAARNGHHANRYFDTVNQTARHVRERFPELLYPAMRLVAAGQRYVDAVAALVARITEEVATAPDSSLFALLDPDRYRDATIHARADRLADVFANTAVDPARPIVDLPSLTAAAAGLAVAPPQRRTAEPAIGRDATAVLQEQLAAHRAEQERRCARMDTTLAEAAEADLTGSLDRWPYAAVLLADLLALGRDPMYPYGVDLSDVQLVDPDAEVAVSLWLRVRRLSAPATLPTAEPEAARER